MTGKRALRLGLAMGAVLFVLAILAPRLAPFDPVKPVAKSFGAPMPPQAPYWLGTDELGRDVLSRLIVGSRITLIVAGAATALAMIVGVAIGVVAGYSGGWIDVVLMRLADIFLAFPSVLLAIAFAALFQPGLFTLLIVIGLVSWPAVARAVRSEVLSLRERDYVFAGVALGAGHLRLMWRHLLPNALGTIIAIAAVSACGAILLEAGLSYLGLGVPVPAPSWGRMISDSLSYFRVAPWLVVFPGLAIVFAALAFNLVGYGLAKQSHAIDQGSGETV